MRNEKPLRSFVFLWTCRLLSLKLQANICFVSGNKSIASLSTISYSSGGDTQSLKALRPQTALDDFHPHKNPPWEKLMEDGCWECFWKEKDLRLTTGGNVRPPAVKCTFSPRRSVICASSYVSHVRSTRSAWQKCSAEGVSADVGDLRRVLELTSCEKAESSSSCFVPDSEASAQHSVTSGENMSHFPESFFKDTRGVIYSFIYKEYRISCERPRRHENPSNLLNFSEIICQMVIWR